MKATAFVSTMQVRLMVAAVLALLSVSGSAIAQDWYWLGSSSANWSDLANWNSAADGTGSVPASTAALQGKNLRLLTTGDHIPSSQDIPGLAVSRLQFDSTVTSFAISGEPVQINDRMDNTANPAAEQTVTFQNRIVLNSSTAWNVNGRMRFNLEGGMGETGGSRSYAANNGGAVRFYGPVTTTGGWRNNQSTAVFYGMETLGVFPTTLMAEYFRTGFGTMQFNSPEGNPYEYEFSEYVGAQSTDNLALNVPTDVVVIFHGPISESAANKNINKQGGGLMYLNGNNTFTGNITLSAGMLVLGGPVSTGNGTPAITSNQGSLDLNGQEVLGRRLTFSNASGFDSAGVLRNSNRSVEATLNGDMTTVANDSAVIQFGGGGDIRWTGNITHSTSSHRICKTGAGTLTFTGNSVYNGPWSTFGGRLVLDYTTDNGRKIGDTATLELNGSLALAGNSAATTTETVGTLRVGTLPNSVRVAAAGAGGQAATLRFAALDVRGNSTLDFAPGAGGTILSSGAVNSANTGTLGSRMVFQGTTFARRGAVADGEGYYEIEGLPDGAYAAAFDGDTAYEFVDVPGSLSVASFETAAAVRFSTATPSTLTLDSSLNLNGEASSNSGYQGGILVTPNVGANATLIDGSGMLGAGSVNGWLHVHQYNTAAPLTIAARINSASSGTCLSKSGPGELILTHSGNYFNELGIYEGTLAVSAIANVATTSPAGYGGTTRLGTATLKYTGSGDSTDRVITLRGHGTIEAAGSGKLTFTAATAVNADMGNDHELTLAGSGEGEVQGRLNLKVGSLVKTGNGIWTLGGNNSFWGGARVDAGTLVVNGTLGRDVVVAAGGTLAGSGSIGHNLTVGGTLAIDLDAGGMTVGKHLDISGGTLVVTGSVGEDPVPVLTCGGTLSGEFASVSEKYVVSYTDGAVLVRAAPPSGTVLLVR